MVHVRLKHSLLIDGKLLKFGSVVDSDQIPEHLLTDEHVSWDTDHREGKVMMLINVTYTMEQIDPLTKGMVAYPCSLAIGEVCALEEIPERQRQDWQDGVEYKSDWTEQERQQLRAEEDARYLAQFQPAKVRIYGS
jgi:hypothetical protein